MTQARPARPGGRFRVLLLDEGFVSGLVTARGLARAGCSVDVIAATAGRGSCRSDTGRWQLAPRPGDPRLLDEIDHIVASSDYDVVYPITEPLQRLLWDNSPAWQSLVFPHVSVEGRLLRRDKQAMSAMISLAGIATPREMPASTDAEVDSAVRELGAPVVIKGIDGRGGSTTNICPSVASARAAARTLAARGVRSFAQEYLDGPTYLAGGVFDKGLPLRFFSGVKRVQFPGGVGPAAEIESVDDAELTSVARRVFSVCHVTGLASVDLMRGRDGRFCFVELNHRPWGSMQAAEDCGVDLFDSLVRHWRGEASTPQLPLRPGVRVPIFPLCLLSWDFLRRNARAVIPNLRSAFATMAREPRMSMHVLHRLLRVAANW